MSLYLLLFIYIKNLLLDGKHCSGFGLATILMNSKPDITKHYWSSYIIHIYVNCTRCPGGVSSDLWLEGRGINQHDGASAR